MKRHFKSLALIQVALSVGLCASAQTDQKTQKTTKTSKVYKYDLVKKKVVNGRVQLVRLAKIPALNLPTEPRIAADNLEPVKLPKPPAPFSFVAKEQKSPEEIFIDTFLLNEIKPAQDAKVLAVVADNQGKPLASPFVLPAFAEAQISTSQVATTPTKDLSPSELKLLQALIFSEIQKNYKLALGLFAELTDDAQVGDEAKYNLAETSYNLGLYAEYKHQMLQLLANKKGGFYLKALGSLVSKTQAGDKGLVATLLPHLASLSEEQRPQGDQFKMNEAQYFLEKNDLTNSLAALDEISLDSPLYLDALFLKSVLMYKAGQVEEAVGVMRTVVEQTLEKRSGSELQGIAALTLARLHFQAGQYKEAFDAYLKVDKRHPEWIQAMIEQAWAQILAQDYEGAAGNMFSLHTDFFKNAFVPESYVVRTVGYLNLCQYGDGAKVIHELKKRFTPVRKQMEEYTKNAKTDLAYYETLKSWAKNPDLKTVDGLPREFIYSLSRHPSFVEEQKMINSIEDQYSQLDKMALDIIKSERELTEAQNKIREKLSEIRKKLVTVKSAERKIELETELEKGNRQLLSVRIQHHIAKKARASIKDFRAKAKSRLELEKNGFLARASLALKNRFSQMSKTLAQTLDQSDVLKYELYSGAGEHLRYQMAGGEVDNKETEKLKVEGDQAMNWDFRGEVWQDELGHFRSSLKNVCPPEENLSSMGN